MKKPTYTETLASLNTHIEYIREHLGNIDDHLEKLNDSRADHDKRITRNTTRIGLAFKVFGSIILLTVTAISILFGTGVI